MLRCFSASLGKKNKNCQANKNHFYHGFHLFYLAERQFLSGCNQSGVMETRPHRRFPFLSASRYQAPNHERADAPAPAGGAPGRARLHRGDAHPERPGYGGLLRRSVHARDTREGRNPPTLHPPKRRISVFTSQPRYVWLSARLGAVAAAASL